MGFNEIFSALGVPALAVALATSLIYSADYFEKNYLKPEQKAALANFFRNGDLRHFDKSIIGLPLHIFDSIFGKRPVSWKFISRSIIASILFWIILGFLRNSLSDFFVFVGTIVHSMMSADTLPLLPLWFFLDWLCLAKSRRLFLWGVYERSGVSEGHIVRSVSLFLVADVISSILLSVLFYRIYFSFLHTIGWIM